MSMVAIHRKFRVLFAFFLISFTLVLSLRPLVCMADELSGAESSKYQWKKMKVDTEDLPSLQRGFKLFMNYCSGCHSLQYMRYNGVAKDIGIVDQQGKVLEQAVKDNLVFTGGKVSDNIISAMKKEDGANWFGIAPPDLTLVTRYRGPQWVYNYLLAFYPDETKIWGVNNYVYPSVAMPYVLEDMQKQMTPEQYNQAIRDIVNFLSYAGEPMQDKRQYIGVFVLIFLGIFTIFAALLKREYWKDVKK